MHQHPTRRSPPSPRATAAPHHASTPPPPPPSTTAAPPLDRRRAHWTPARQRIFLAALFDSGSVAAAARAAGMSRSSAHRLRQRLAGTPFVQAWDRVMAAHAGRLANPFAKDERTPPARTPDPVEGPPRP